MVDFREVFYYKRCYKNWLTVLAKQALPGDRMRKTIRVLPRNGTEYMSVNPWVAHHYVQLNFYRNDNISNPFILDGGILYFEYKSIPLRFDIPSYATIFESFVREDYSWLLPVEGETVVDIGANIGDTPLYFAANGAHRVIALEPFPLAYRTAKKNIDISGFDQKIDLINCGYGNDGFIELNDNESASGMPLRRYEGGSRIQIISMKTIIEKNSLDHEIGMNLKMDCEGCEYHILNEDCSVLSKFKKIQMEYHYGPTELAEKLSSCGFKVRYTDPVKLRVRENEKTLLVGMIYAVQE